VHFVRGIFNGVDRLINSHKKKSTAETDKTKKVSILILKRVSQQQISCNGFTVFTLRCVPGCNRITFQWSTTYFFGLILRHSVYICNIQGDSYSFINILTSGRFRSQKALDNTILSHTSKIGKNYHICFFTISKCHSSLNYSLYVQCITNVMNVIIEANNCCYRENICIIKFALVSF
jgi:hypothetical protein